MMNTNHCKSYLLALALATALTTPVWAQVDLSYLPEVQQQGEIRYLSGGVGDDETAALQSVKEQYNLRVTSADKTGEYRGDTRIVIRDLKQNVLLDTTSNGPLFYTNLPNGRYVVEGYSEGQSKRKNVTIKNATHARVHFSW
jgi:hypothetical protein